MIGGNTGHYNINKTQWFKGGIKSLQIKNFH